MPSPCITRINENPVKWVTIAFELSPFAEVTAFYNYDKHGVTKMHRARKFKET